MNNRRIGKLAVTAIVGIISAISGIASIEYIQNVKKEPLGNRFSEDKGKGENLSWEKNRKTTDEG